MYEFNNLFILKLQVPFKDGSAMQINQKQGWIGTYLETKICSFVMKIDIKYVDIATRGFLSSVNVANIDLRYWSISFSSLRTRDEAKS